MDAVDAAPFLVRDVLTGRLGRIDLDIWKPAVRWEAPSFALQQTPPELIDWSRLEAVEPAAISVWRTRFDLIFLLALTAVNGAVACLAYQ